MHSIHLYGSIYACIVLLAMPFAEVVEGTPLNASAAAGLPCTPCRMQKNMISTTTIRDERHSHGVFTIRVRRGATRTLYHARFSTAAAHAGLFSSAAITPFLLLLPCWHGGAPYAMPHAAGAAWRRFSATLLLLVAWLFLPFHAMPGSDDDSGNSAAVTHATMAGGGLFLPMASRRGREMRCLVSKQHAPSKGARYMLHMYTHMRRYTRKKYLRKTEPRRAHREPLCAFVLLYIWPRYKQA